MTNHTPFKKTPQSLTAALIAIFLYAPVQAQTVDAAFRGNDGDLSISGQLLEITSNAYVVSTQVGTLTLVPNEVTYISRACPIAETEMRQIVPAQSRPS